MSLLDCGSYVTALKWPRPSTSNADVCLALDITAVQQQLTAIDSMLLTAASLYLLSPVSCPITRVAVYPVLTNARTHVRITGICNDDLYN